MLHPSLLKLSELRTWLPLSWAEYMLLLSDQHSLNTLHTIVEFAWSFQIQFHRQELYIDVGPTSA